MTMVKIMPSALEKMKDSGRTYTIYLESRGG